MRDEAAKVERTEKQLASSAAASSWQPQSGKNSVSKSDGSSSAVESEEKATIVAEKKDKNPANNVTAPTTGSDEAVAEESKVPAQIVVREERRNAGKVFSKENVTTKVAEDAQNQEA